jgi:hypothetical protein
MFVFLVAMLSFAHLKIFFNEVYACSLAFFHLSVTIILRLFNAGHHRKPPPSADHTQKRAKRGDASTTIARPLQLHASCTEPHVDPYDDEPIVLSSVSSSPAICQVSYDSCMTERSSDCLSSPSSSCSDPADISVSEGKRSLRSKYSFKRRRRASRSASHDAEHLGSPPSPEIVASSLRRIKVDRRRARPALRPMILFQDPAIDLRPFLLPEQVARRGDLQVLESIGLTAYSTHYPFQTPLMQGPWVEDEIEDSNYDIDVAPLSIRANVSWMDLREEVRGSGLMDVSF